MNAHPWMTFLFESLNDGLFTWPTPDGRPDENEYWLSTSANLTTWNLGIWLIYAEELASSFSDQTPQNIKDSPTQMVEYWLGRMIGFESAPEVTNALTEDALGPAGVMNDLEFGQKEDIEEAFARMAALIATTEEFSSR